MSDFNSLFIGYFSRTDAGTAIVRLRLHHLYLGSGLGAALAYAYLDFTSGGY